jgi:hypothetical protein
MCWLQVVMKTWDLWYQIVAVKDVSQSDWVFYIPYAYPIDTKVETIYTRLTLLQKLKGCVFLAYLGEMQLDKCTTK